MCRTEDLHACHVANGLAFPCIRAEFLDAACDAPRRLSKCRNTLQSTSPTVHQAHHVLHETANALKRFTGGIFAMSFVSVAISMLRLSLMVLAMPMCCMSACASAYSFVTPATRSGVHTQPADQPVSFSCCCRIRSWRFDSLDGANAAAQTGPGNGFYCGVGAAGVFSVSGPTGGSPSSNGCLVQVDRTNTGGTSTASVSVTSGTVSATVRTARRSWRRIVIVIFITFSSVHC